MINPASTLLLASLVFNAASVLGAPVRIPPASQPVARAVVDDPLQSRRMETVDLPAHLRSVDPEFRSIHETREIAPEYDIRDTASSYSIEARDPPPDVKKLVRRYPRQVYRDYYEARSRPESPPVASPEPNTKPQAERRFFRRALFERHQQPSDPKPPQARAAPVESPERPRAYPRRIYAEHHEKRALPPSPPEEIVARAPTPESQDPPLRRFPRQVYAEHYARQAEPAEDSPADPAAEPSTDGAATPVNGTLSPGALPANGTVNGTVAESSNLLSSPPMNLTEIIKTITNNNHTGFQPGTTIKETTLVYNKVTHISEPKKDAPPVVIPNKSDPVTSPSSTTVSSGTPSSPSPSASASAVPSGTTTPPEGSPTTPDESTLSPSPSASATPDESSSTSGDTGSTGDGSTTSTTGTGEGDAGKTDEATRRSLGNDQASPEPNLRGRNLGYSGPAWASYAKRTVPEN